ncbi:MAG: hypothetical protein ACTS6G_03820 [Candidatus Hodgkinia cicadicola]
MFNLFPSAEGRSKGTPKARINWTSAELGGAWRGNKLNFSFRGYFSKLVSVLSFFQPAEI